ncbi:unnamed protein product [Bemisia tabaci]|uniref:Ig-like domain-containing protein n=1 Tax=Bemisia tabaci TaxID=7038 RepID=A0A9P0A8B9_BEMTA|nr:unnamed protein product [Bemisia tabaci]
MRVDHHTVKGNSTLLECKFDLEGSRLYTVKWYKDGHEFYRFLPKDKPQVLTFPVPGVHVDTGNSSASQVLLTDLDLSSTGRYRCEVSGEAPAFETVTDHGDMITVGESSPRPPCIDISFVRCGAAVVNACQRRPPRYVSDMFQKLFHDSEYGERGRLYEMPESLLFYYVILT